MTYLSPLQQSLSSHVLLYLQVTILHRLVLAHFDASTWFPGKLPFRQLLEDDRVISLCRRPSFFSFSGVFSVFSFVPGVVFSKVLKVVKLMITSMLSVDAYLIWTSEHLKVLWFIWWPLRCGANFTSDVHFNFQLLVSISKRTS